MGHAEYTDARPTMRAGIGFIRHSRATVRVGLDFPLCIGEIIWRGDIISTIGAGAVTEAGEKQPQVGLNFSGSTYR